MSRVKAAEKTSYHHGNLRDALVEEGMSLLETEGLKALSLREVARHTGVSQTAPLHHFAGKTGLLAAIAALGFRRLFEYRTAALKNKRDPRVRLMTVMLAYLEFAKAHPSLFYLMHGPEIPEKTTFPELDEAATRSYSVLETCVAEYLQATEGSAECSREATLAAWTACYGLAVILTSPQNTPRMVLRRDQMGIAEKIFEMFIHGLAQKD
ncbi:MAG: TetR/AcrR family transcriptional regulator [Candidatus Protistobacter heckmanni]|nr:TetR/AcrR family transcriptional regulator [Candidatus Protistobacter heckmanni]